MHGEEMQIEANWCMCRAGLLDVLMLVWLSGMPSTLYFNIILIIIILPRVLSQVPVLSSGNSTTLPKGLGIFCMVLPHT